MGSHWASLAARPTSIDIGVGYAGSFRSLPPDTIAIDLFAQPADLAATPVHLHGGYAEASYAIENQRRWRTWLGARVEILGGDYRGATLVAFGAAARLGAEVFTAGTSKGGGSVTSGTFALGVYVEGTARTLPAELGRVGLGAGVSMRVPFIAAIGL